MTVQTLRFYERRGLLAEPRRSPGGHRVYPSDALTTLRVIKAAQRLGFTLDEIAELVDLHRPGRRSSRSSPQAAANRSLPKQATTNRSLQQRVASKLTEIDRRIADLQLIAASLRAGLDAGCDDLATCATTAGCPLPFAGPRELVAG